MGDGQSINIWTEPWLARSYSFKVFSSPSMDPHGLHSLSKVSDLIDNGLHRWKEDLVRGNFSEDDAAAILAIPISKRGVADRGMWHHTIDGEFTVR